MDRVVRIFIVIYAVVFAVVIVLAVLSLLGFFENEFMQPAL